MLSCHGDLGDVRGCAGSKARKGNNEAGVSVTACMKSQCFCTDLSLPKVRLEWISITLQGVLPLANLTGIWEVIKENTRTTR